MWFLYQIFLFVSCSHSLQHARPSTSTPLTTHGTGRRDPGVDLHQNAPTLVLGAQLPSQLCCFQLGLIGGKLLTPGAHRPTNSTAMDRLDQDWRTYGMRHSMLPQIFISFARPPSLYCKECVCIYTQI